MSQSGSGDPGGDGGVVREGFQDLSFTKYVDKSTPLLMQQLAIGEPIDAPVELIVRRAGENDKKEAKYFLVTMEKVMVTSISTGGSGGEDRLTENVTLNFAKVTVAYTPQDDKGTAGEEHTFSWDVELDGPI